VEVLNIHWYYCRQSKTQPWLGEGDGYYQTLTDSLVEECCTDMPNGYVQADRRGYCLGLYRALSPRLKPRLLPGAW
jgi:hypothetical protein